MTQTNNQITNAVSNLGVQAFDLISKIVSVAAGVVAAGLIIYIIIQYFNMSKADDMNKSLIAQKGVKNAIIGIIICILAIPLLFGIKAIIDSQNGGDGGASSVLLNETITNLTVHGSLF